MEYRNYKIEPGGHGYTYVHDDYEGATFIGEDIESRDKRCGSCKTIEECKSEIDGLEEDLAEMLGDQIDKLTALLKQPKKSVLETCDTIQMVDDNGRLITIYYRTLEGCRNAQTDIEETFYDIERVEYLNRKVKLSSRGENDLLEWLYRTNPEKARA